MRLYLDIDSSENIPYTPDCMMVRNGGDEMTFDIQGDTDYSESGMHCRVKGDLFILKKDDYKELSKSDQDKLAKMLRSKKTEFVFSIYPAIGYDNHEDEYRINKDKIMRDHGEGTIYVMLNKKEYTKNFKFTVEFYGI